MLACKGILQLYYIVRASAEARPDRRVGARPTGRARYNIMKSLLARAFHGRDKLWIRPKNSIRF